MSAEEIRAHKDERKEEVAQEKYGKHYDELEGRERQSVGGTVGGEIRKAQMSEATGGDVHKAYSEMGHQQGGGKTQGEEEEK